MIIQSDTISMGASRSYKSRSGNITSSVIGNDKTGFYKSFSSITNQSEQKRRNFKSGTGFLMKDFRSVREIKQVDMSDNRQSLHQLRVKTIDYLLYILFGRNSPINEEFNNNEEWNDNKEVIENSTGEQENNSGYNFTLNYFEETETTTFNTVGTVKTSDGRSIDFNVELIMSRTFMEASADIISFDNPVFMDPLVINLDCASADVSDQKFYFDLNGDGNEEYISKLSPGSGYLALDKNNDGVINDGTELFGTQSGNGFADLMKYDSDGNGWIDEADEIFEQLRIWSMDEDGKSTLIGLGKAGVGAIYLGSRETEFTLNSEDNNTNAVVRRTGMFLYEQGSVGTMQQLDLTT